MAGAAVLWSIATGLTALADRFPILPPAISFHLPFPDWFYSLSRSPWALCFVRALVGIGESSYSTITPTLIADYVPLQRRATALGVSRLRYRWDSRWALYSVVFSENTLAGVGVHGCGTAGTYRECVRLEIERAGTWQGRICKRIRSTLRLPARQPASRGSACPGASFARVIGFSSTAGYTALTFVLGAFSTCQVFY